MKKIFMYLIIFIGFIFAFFHGDKINILAYTQYDNTLGTYPAKLDIDNYDIENKLIINDIPLTSLNGIELYSNNGTIYINGNSIRGVSFDITKYTNVTNISYNNGDYITFQSFTTGNCTSSNRCVEYNLGVTNNVYFLQSSYTTGNYNNVTKYPNRIINENLDGLRIYVAPGNYINFEVKFMILFSNESNYHLENYVPPFKFGNMVGYQLNLYNPTSSNITTNVQINNYDNQVLNKSVTVNANSYYELKGNISTNSQGTTDTRFYLPYNISSDGTISIDYKLIINITNPDIVIKSDENIQNDSYFLFEPVFNAYYKGELTNNLYFKNSYVFNSLMYTGMNARGQGLNSLYFNCYGNVSDNYCIYDSLTISPNTTENVLAFNVTSTGIRNNINFNDVFIYGYTDSYGFDSTSTLFSFQLNIGDINTSLTSGVSYDINMSEFTLLVINNNSTTSPLPNNPNTINKYNVCDAWYDIPCQLGNAVTYVIYEAPIISPVLTFIVSFITMFSSLVSFIDLFSSFGIVFGCFVIYMFIELLNKYSK